MQEFFWKVFNILSYVKSIFGFWGLVLVNQPTVNSGGVNDALNKQKNAALIWTSSISALQCSPVKLNVLSVVQCSV